MDKEFFFENEDTTLVGILHEKLLKNKEVVFAGYIQHHPLDHNINLRVKTHTIDPEIVLIDVIKSIITELKELKEKTLKNI